MKGYLCLKLLFNGKYSKAFADCCACQIDNLLMLHIGSGFELIN